MNEREYIEQQAAQWVLRQEERDWSPALQSRLDAWLEESVAHKAAYWRLNHGWKMADIPAERPRSFRLHMPANLWTGSLPQFMALAASLVLMVLASLVWFGPNWSPSPEAVEYSTGRGQVSTLQISDGTEIKLNTQTSVRIELSGEKRRAWLDRGEAFFDVAHDPSRPFIVHAGARDVAVLGTKFNIRRETQQMIVSVVEGHVRLTDPSGKNGLTATTITRGDRAVVKGSSTLVMSGQLRRIEDELSWRSGMIAFDHTPLSRAVEEFNRYNDLQLEVRDPEISRILIGGTFRAGNAAGFARLLHDVYGIGTEWKGDKIILSGN